MAEHSDVNIVLTVLKDSFPKDPLITNPKWTYIMFTDNREVKSDYWKVAYTDNLEEVKEKPYNFFQYTNLVYVDGSCLYMGDPDEILAMMNGASMFTGNDKLWAVSSSSGEVCHYTKRYFNKVCVQFGNFHDGENIKYTIPYALDGNLGKAYNEQFNTGHAWVCVSDGDFMFLDNQWGRKIEQVIKVNDGDIYGCATNRLMLGTQLFGGERSENDSVMYHKKVSDDLWKTNGTKTIDADYVAGMFMLVKKRVWQEVKFKNGLTHIDIDFCQRARKKGFKVKVMTGVYGLHYYRLGTDVERIPHLIRSND